MLDFVHNISVSYVAMSLQGKFCMKRSTILYLKDHIASKTAYNDFLSPFITSVFGVDAEMSCLTCFQRWIMCFEKTSARMLANDFNTPPSHFSDMLNSIDNSWVKNITFDFFPQIASKFLADNDGDDAYTGFRISQSTTNLSDSVSTFIKAIKLIEFSTKTQCNEINTELTKICLMKVLRCKDTDGDSIYCVANVYLVVLYYTTGQYQRAIDHCTLVTRSKNHSQCSLYLVQGMHLPKIDDNIDNALGLAVYYQYLRTVTLTACYRFKVDTGVFTPELFAHYLVSKRLLVPKCRIAAASIVNPTTQTMSEHLTMYRNQLLDCTCNHIVPSDLLLCKLPNNIGMVQHTMKKNVFPSTSVEAIQLLKQDSIEIAINFSQLLVSERSVYVSSIVGFLPLYLYRCGLYDRCLKLCQENIHAVINDDVCRMPRLSCTYREFIQLMDSDVVSLLGLTLLVDRTAGAHTNFTGPMTVSQLSLTLYLLTQSQSCCNLSRHDEIPEVLDLIADVEKIVASDNFLDQLVLKLTLQKAIANAMRSVNRRPNFSRRNTAYCKYFADLMASFVNKL